MKHYMSSRGFCGFGITVFPGFGAICRAAFASGQAVVGAGSALPHMLCRQGLLSRELRSRSKAEFASGACRSCQPKAFGPSFTWPDLSCSGLCVHLQCSLPSVVGASVWRMPAEQKCFCAFLPAPLGLSHHFSLYFSGIFS